MSKKAVKSKIGPSKVTTFISYLLHISIQLQSFLVQNEKILCLFHFFIIIGGERKLSVRETIPVVDISKWIQENTRKEDYVIFKLDVEGAEFDVIKKMLKDGTFEWVDK